MRVLKAVCCAAMLTVLAAPGVRADEWNKKTILTFSGPVQIPGATLPAGSYVFKLADIPGNRHVVQVFDKDEHKIFATMLAVPNQRLEPSDKPIVLFSERAAGSPQAVKVWRSHSTHDISLWMFTLMLVGTALWLAYGIMLGRPALIFANGTSLTLIAWIGWFKLRYG